MRNLLTILLFAALFLNAGVSGNFALVLCEHSGETHIDIGSSHTCAGTFVSVIKENNPTIFSGCTDTILKVKSFDKFTFDTSLKIPVPIEIGNVVAAPEFNSHAFCNTRMTPALLVRRQSCTRSSPLII